MRFIETPVFTRTVQRHFDDEAYRALQLALVLRPELGSIIPGGAGVRKMRWASKGKGKRGSLRVIYYWAVAEETFYMLYVYRKISREISVPLRFDRWRDWFVRS